MEALLIKCIRLKGQRKLAGYYNIKAVFLSSYRKQKQNDKIKVQP